MRKRCQRLAFVEYPFVAGTIPIDIMEEHLRKPFSRERVAPMRHLHAAINHPVTRRQLDSGRAGTGIDPDRPRWTRMLSKIHRDADFAGGPIRMAGQGIATPIYAEIGIGWGEAESAFPFDARAQVLQQGLHERIAESAWRAGYLPVAILQSSISSQTLCIIVQEFAGRGIQDVAYDDISIRGKGVCGCSHCSCSQVGGGFRARRCYSPGVPSC